MRVLAYDRFTPGVTMETITPYLTEEVANVWLAGTGARV